MYEELAQQNTGADRAAYALQAAHAWIAARRPDDAARALAMAQPPLTPEQTFDRQMLDVEVLLGRGQGALALQRLNSLPRPGNPADAARYQSLQQQATLAAAGQPPNGQLPPPTPSVSAAAHIALLLPVTGQKCARRLSRCSDGFMTAFYQQPVAERPQIRVYDTGGTSIAEAVTHATQEGADFIVGPLTKEEITAASELAMRRPPILALNFLPAERPAPAAFYQFALSPEDEARLVARRILADGHRAGIAFVPAGDWGTRVLAAFTQELQAGGGAAARECADRLGSHRLRGLDHTSAAHQRQRGRAASGWSPFSARSFSSSRAAAPTSSSSLRPRLPTWSGCCGRSCDITSPATFPRTRHPMHSSPIRVPIRTSRR